MEVSGQLHASVALPPEKATPIPIGLESGCAPEPVYTRWRRETILPPSRESNPVRGARNLVFVLTELKYRPLRHSKAFNPRNMSKRTNFFFFDICVACCMASYEVHALRLHLTWIRTNLYHSAVNLFVGWPFMIVLACPYTRCYM